MRVTIYAFLLALAVTGLGGGTASAEKVRCSAIRDSALCAAEPSCWYDAANNKGCQDGPRPAEDACGVHGGEALCNADTALGCMWDAGGGACVTKP